MSTTTTRNVHFAVQDVSAVFYVPRKTESEALTLFYQPEECDRFRAEAQLEKLASELCRDHALNNGNAKLSAITKSVCSGSTTNIESLNALTQLARYQFKGFPVMTSAHGFGGTLPPTLAPRPRASRGTAGMA